MTAYESQATVQFQIGTSSAYGTTTPAQQFIGLTPLPVTAPVTGLLPTTTYHYRELATSIEGTSFGADQTFITPPATRGTHAPT